jgi:putative CocE/NonD family hydrolase
MMKAAPLVRANVPVTVPGGVRLATDVYRPATEVPVPVVLIRTPSAKSAHLEEGLGWARHGFACVIQDVRGRYDSEGTWYPYRDERDDGAAVVDWLAKQPWTDGRVVACGSSYAAFTAWTAAVERPEIVCAVISLIAAMGLDRVKFDDSGVLRLAEHVGWWLTFGDSRTSRPGLTAAMLKAVPDILRHLPVSGLSERLWAELPSWTGVINAGPDTPPAAGILDHELAKLDLPVLHIGGWYDLLISETLRQWEIAGAEVTPRPLRGLVIGPWNQERLGWTATTRLGDREYGPQSRLALGGLMARWARGALDGTAADAEEPAVRVFIMGENRWSTGLAWPPHPLEEVTLHVCGGGRLGPDQRDIAGEDSFSYDPLDPFPALARPVDRTALSTRKDALRYTSSPLTEPLRIAGAPRVLLHAATDADQTDWVVRLVEGLSDGQQIAITQGCVDTQRAGGRSGEINLYEIRMTPTATTIPAGHTVRLEVTSSDFPVLARNLNTGEDRYTTRRAVLAHQRVLFGPQTPTALILPVAASP